MGGFVILLMEKIKAFYEYHSLTILKPIIHEATYCMQSVENCTVYIEMLLVVHDKKQVALKQKGGLL